MSILSERSKFKINERSFIDFDLIGPKDTTDKLVKYYFNNNMNKTYIILNFVKKVRGEYKKRFFRMINLTFGKHAVRILINGIKRGANDIWICKRIAEQYSIEATDQIRANRRVKMLERYLGPEILQDAKIMDLGGEDALAHNILFNKYNVKDYHVLNVKGEYYHRRNLEEHFAAKKAKFMWYDGKRLPDNLPVYDIIMMNNVVHHISIHDLKTLIDSMKKHAKYVIIKDQNIKDKILHEIYVIQHMIYDTITTGKVAAPYIEQYSAEYIKSLFSPDDWSLIKENIDESLKNYNMSYVLVLHSK